MLVRDITERVEGEVWERKFHDLLIHTASEFMQRPLESYGEIVDEILGEIGRFVEVDRCSVFWMRDGGEIRDNTHEWCAAGIELNGRFYRVYVQMTHRGGCNSCRSCSHL